MTQSQCDCHMTKMNSKMLEIKSNRSIPVVDRSQLRKISEDDSKLDSSRIWIKRKPYRMYMFTSPQTTNYNNLYFDKKLCQIQISTCFLHVMHSYPCICTGTCDWTKAGILGFLKKFETKNMPLLCSGCSVWKTTVEASLAQLMAHVA